MAEQRTLPQFLEALGSRPPTPGGGAASALAAALAAALAEMVARLTAGRARYQEVDAAMRAVIEKAAGLREQLLELIEEDEQAYAGVSAAFRLPKTTDDERALRDAAVQVALVAAMQPPLQVMQRACDVLDLAVEVAASGNVSVVSDAGCAALIGEAAARAAGLNVLANVVLLRDEATAAQAREAMVTLEERATALREHAMASVHARMQRT
jgi:glutamate formiminotransferase/formiminotetrahydrofolate cyclodeaminase